MITYQNPNNEISVEILEGISAGWQHFEIHCKKKYPIGCQMLNLEQCLKKTITPFTLNPILTTGTGNYSFRISTKLSSMNYDKIIEAVYANMGESLTNMTFIDFMGVKTTLQTRNQ